MTETAKTSPEVLEIDFSRPVKLTGTRVGKLVAWSENEGPVVDHGSNPHGPIQARTTVRLDPAEAHAAVDRGQEVLLVFEAERSDRPIIVGLLQEEHGEQRRENDQPADGLSEPAPGEEKLEAVVDGRSVVFDAKDEIVLRCGEASITLRRNGRIVVRGTHVETRSKGVNRIKGGVVRIN
ncbi:MAG: DUF6484 domain-containing protein [Myxococcota bacterium]